MRVMVMFDLPTITAEDKREYTKFRKYLIKSGFLMMQESVYTKMALNKNAADSVVETIRKNKPLSGIVQVMVVTEKQYNKMEYIVGQYNGDILNTDERLVII